MAEDEKKKPSKDDKYEGKKTPGKKHKQTALEMFKEAFVGSDGDDFKRFLIQDVIVPTIQDGIIDGVLSSLGMFMYGDKFEMGRGKRRRGRSRFDDDDGYRYHDYHASYRKKKSRWDDDDDDDDDRRRRCSGSLYKFECVEYRSKEEAFELMDDMQDYLDEYDEISIAKMYEMANLPVKDTDFNYGWKKLDGAKVVTIKHRDGKSYIVDMPRPVPLND